MSAEQQSTAWSKISLCWKVSNSLQVGAQMCHTHLPTDNVPRLHPEWQGGDSGCQPAPQGVEPQPGGCSCCQKGSVAAGYPINSLCMAGWLFSERLAWIFAPCGSSGLQPVCTVLLMWTGGHSVLAWRNQSWNPAERCLSQDCALTSSTWWISVRFHGSNTSSKLKLTAFHSRRGGMIPSSCSGWMQKICMWAQH